MEGRILARRGRGAGGKFAEEGEKGWGGGPKSGGGAFSGRRPRFPWGWGWENPRAQKVEVTRGAEGGDRRALPKSEVWNRKKNGVGGLYASKGGTKLVCATLKKKKPRKTASKKTLKQKS